MNAAQDASRSGEADVGRNEADEPLVDVSLTAEERLFRERVREFMRTSLPISPEVISNSGTFAGPNYVALAQAGLAGRLVPTEFGGQGGSTVAYAVAMEEISAVCGSTALVYMTQLHAAFPILVAGTESQKNRYVPALGNGDQYGSLAITEPGAGSDVSRIRTVARPDGDGYILNGGKTFITTGDRANVIVCFATIDASRGRDAVTAFIVEGDAPGLTRGPELKKLGMRGSSTAELFFDGVRLPAKARLGVEGGAWKLSMATVVKSRISAASQGLGIARAAYSIGRDWAFARGHLTGYDHQSIQFELADIRIRILQARLLLHSVARAADVADRDLTAEVGMAKIVCTDLGVDVSNRIVRMLGLEGDLASQGVERNLRDAKVTQIYDGTNQIQRILVTRDTLGRCVSADPGLRPAGIESSKEAS
jgi:alkylation response protein AidB-like acyl-CoA dehydrogenase